MNILEQLWGGSIRPAERSVKKGTEFDRLQKDAQKAHDRLWSMLSAEEKDAFTALMDIDIEMTCISDADIFTKGFRLGMRLLLAAICEENSQLPALEDD